MKKLLLYIDNMHRGGAQRVMSNLANHLCQTHEVLLVNDAPELADRAVYPVDPKIKRLFLRDSFGGNPVLKNVERIRKLRQILKAEQPDVVLSFLGQPNERMLLASRGLPCRKVVSVRNDPNREYGPGDWRKKLACALFAKADGVVFQTPDAAAYFPETVQNKSRIILNPVDRRFYEARRAAETVRDVVTVGRMEPQKNHKLLLRAWKQVEEAFPQERLVFYGDGPLRSELERLAKDLGISQRVEFAGAVTDVERRLSAAKLFVLPSDYEGLPNALMEAMAAGTPAISTDCPCGGPKLLIQDGKGGRLVSCRDESALAEAIRQMLGNEQERESMGAAARSRAKEFVEDAVYRQWEEFLLG